MIVNQWIPAAHRGDAIGDSARRVRDLLRETADEQYGGFNYEYGYGVLNVEGLLARLDELDAPPSNRSVRGRLRN